MNNSIRHSAPVLPSLPSYGKCKKTDPFESISSKNATTAVGVGLLVLSVLTSFRKSEPMSVDATKGNAFQERNNRSFQQRQESERHSQPQDLHPVADGKRANNIDSKRAL